MSLKTKILGLFKYDPDKDGASTFKYQAGAQRQLGQAGQRSCSACKDHGIGFRGQEDRERRQLDRP